MITSDTLCLTFLCEVCERKTAIFVRRTCRCKYPFIEVFAGPPCAGFQLTHSGARRGPSTAACALKAAGFEFSLVISPSSVSRTNLILTLVDALDVSGRDTSPYTTEMYLPASHDQLAPRIMIGATIENQLFMAGVRYPRQDVAPAVGHGGPANSARSAGLHLPIVVLMAVAHLSMLSALG